MALKRVAYWLGRLCPFRPPSRNPAKIKTTSIKIMDQVSAFAPSNISCVFKVVPHEDATKMHSLGMGFTINEGVVVTVSPCNQTRILFNGDEIHFPTVVSALQKLTPETMQVDIASSQPLGCGFGLSGASALATAFAVNELLSLGKSSRDLAMMAHVAEVENLTGLGDVCAQYHGGCLVKLKAGHPLSAERLPVREQPIFYKYFSPIRTRDVLTNSKQTDDINRSADRALRNLGVLVNSESVDFNTCIGLSKVFAIESGLLKDQNVRCVIHQIESENGFASMIMLGNAVFSTHPFAGAKETMISMERVRLL